MGGTLTGHSPVITNIFALPTDMKPLVRPEMYLKDKMSHLYEFNARYDEQVKRGEKPLGDKLTLWL